MVQTGSARHEMARSTTTARALLLALAVALVAGLVWGAATSGLQTVLRGPWSALANAITPWVLPAFIAGAFARRPLPALLLGLVVCLGEVGGYYLVSSARGFGVGTGEVVLWSATALVGGPAFALAGWAWRRAPASRWAWPALGAAMLVGVLLVEGGFQYGWVLGYTGSAVLFCALGVLALAALGAWVPARTRPRPAGTHEPQGMTGVRGVAATTAWLAAVVPAGVLGEMMLGALTV